MSKVAFLELRN